MIYYVKALFIISCLIFFFYCYKTDNIDKKFEIIEKFFRLHDDKLIEIENKLDRLNEKIDEN